MLSYGSSILKQSCLSQNNMLIDEQLEQQIRAEMDARDKKIKDLTADKLKLKALLRKAKEAIESVSSKHKTACEQMKL